MSLTMLPAHGQPFRWLPKHGRPLCVGEWFSQSAVRMVAYAPIYTAIVVTLTLITYLVIEVFL